MLVSPVLEADVQDFFNDPENADLVGPEDTTVENSQGINHQPSDPSYTPSKWINPGNHLQAMIRWKRWQGQEKRADSWYGTHQLVNLLEFDA